MTRIEPCPKCGDDDIAMGIDPITHACRNCGADRSEPSKTCRHCKYWWMASRSTTCRHPDTAQYVCGDLDPYNSDFGCILWKSKGGDADCNPTGIT